MALVETIEHGMELFTNGLLLSALSVLTVTTIVIAAKIWKHK